jgi:hypothetical protein
MTTYSNLKIIRFALLWMLLQTHGISEISAQSAGNTASFTRIGTSPRIIAIGNAYAAGGSEGFYAAYNPAIVAGVNYNQFDMSAAAMSLDRNLASVQLTFPLPPRAGLAFDILYAGVTEFDGRTQSGYHTEMFASHDFQLAATFGLQVSNRISFGTRIKYLNTRYGVDIDPSSSVAADVGLRFRINDKTSLGFTVQDLLGEYIWDSSSLYGTVGSRQTTDKLPRRVKFGFWHSLTSYNLNLYGEFENRMMSGEQISRDVVMDFSRPVSRYRRDNVNYTAQMLRTGVSWFAHERVTLRSGWESGDLRYFNDEQRVSIGFTINLPFDLYSPEIDYVAHREPGGFTWMHMFSVRLNINKKLP